MDCIINNSNQTICNWIELMKVVLRGLWCNLGTSYSNESGHSLKCSKFASAQCHSKCMRHAFILLKHHRSSHWSTRTLIWRAFGPLNGRMAGWVNNYFIRDVTMSFELQMTLDQHTECILKFRMKCNDLLHLTACQSAHFLLHCVTVPRLPLRTIWACDSLLNVDKFGDINRTAPPPTEPPFIKHN